MQPKLLQKENIHSEWMCQSAQFRLFFSFFFFWNSATAERGLPTLTTLSQHPKGLSPNSQVLRFVVFSPRVTRQLSQNVVRRGPESGCRCLNQT